MPFEEKTVETINFVQQIEVSEGLDIKNAINEVIPSKVVSTGKKIKLVIQINGQIE